MKINWDAAGTYIIKKLKEPSTWIGLGSLCTAIGWNIRPDLWPIISLLGMGIGGFLATVLTEGRGQPPT